MYLGISDRLALHLTIRTELPDLENIHVWPHALILPLAAAAGDSA